ncbi:hypothetical protein JCM5296_002188 [Sporobolomyces johnsonii]
MPLSQAQASHPPYGPPFPTILPPLPPHMMVPPHMAPSYAPVRSEYMPPVQRPFRGGGRTEAPTAPVRDDPAKKTRSAAGPRPSVPFGHITETAEPIVQTSVDEFLDDPSTLGFRDRMTLLPKNDEYPTFNQIPEAILLAKFPAKLSGVARKWHSQRILHRDVPQTWADWKEALQKRFMSNSWLREQEERYHTMQYAGQPPLEWLEDFVIALRAIQPDATVKHIQRALATPVPRDMALALESLLQYYGESLELTDLTERFEDVASMAYPDGFCRSPTNLLFFQAKYTEPDLPLALDHDGKISANAALPAWIHPHYARKDRKGTANDEEMDEGGGSERDSCSTSPAHTDTSVDVNDVDMPDRNDNMSNDDSTSTSSSVASFARKISSFSFKRLLPTSLMSTAFKSKQPRTSGNNSFFGSTRATGEAGPGPRSQAAQSGLSSWDKLGIVRSNAKVTTLFHRLPTGTSSGSTDDVSSESEETSDEFAQAPGKHVARPSAKAVAGAATTFFKSSSPLPPSITGFVSHWDLPIVDKNPNFKHHYDPNVAAQVLNRAEAPRRLGLTPNSLATPLPATASTNDTYTTPE